jgi:hypothetical protein
MCPWPNFLGYCTPWTEYPLDRNKTVTFLKAKNEYLDEKEQAHMLMPSFPKLSFLTVNSSWKLPVTE